MACLYLLCNWLVHVYIWCSSVPACLQMLDTTFLLFIPAIRPVLRLLYISIHQYVAKCRGALAVASFAGGLFLQGLMLQHRCYKCSPYYHIYSNVMRVSKFLLPEVDPRVTIESQNSSCLKSAMMRTIILFEKSHLALQLWSHYSRINTVVSMWWCAAYSDEHSHLL